MRKKTALCCSLAMLLATPAWSAPAAEEVVVRPQEYPGALRNPFMGFRSNRPDHPWASIGRWYIPWNALESQESDPPERVRQAAEKILAPLPALNKKAGLRIWLHLPKGGQPRDYGKRAWPADLKDGDYSSPAFVARVKRLVQRMGQAWDVDPRVAYLEMGLIGAWGEHHTPDVSPEMQKVLGEAFTAAFPHKSVLVRHPWDFKDYRFGIHWDSWAHVQQMKTHAAGIEALGDRWKTAPIGGETAYDWGDYRIQPGDNPTDTVKDPAHRRFLIDTIRRLHANHLGWVADYDLKDPQAAAGAEEVQKAFGYRFVVTEVRYPAQVQAGRDFAVAFAVRNDGSSPCYLHWPVELSLADPQTHRPVWRKCFAGLDIRTWIGGDKWDPLKQAYAQPPALHQVRGTFALDPAVPPGRYVLALSVLDPAGNLPSLRLAIRNYWTGGRHPIGYISVPPAPPAGQDAPKPPAAPPDLDPKTFDDPAADKTLHYLPNSTDRNSGDSPS